MRQARSLVFAGPSCQAASWSAGNPSGTGWTPGNGSTDSSTSPDAYPRQPVSAFRPTGVSSTSSVAMCAHFDQAAVEQVCEEGADVALDVGERALVLIRESLRCTSDRLVGGEQVEDPAAGDVQPLVPAGLEVENDRLAHEGSVDDMVGNARVCAEEQPAVRLRHEPVSPSSSVSARIPTPRPLPGSRIRSAASLRVRTPSFRNEDLRWLLTVASARCSLVAIS